MHKLYEVATDDNFDEDAYLFGNPDVADAVAAKVLASGKEHYSAYGKAEGRRQRYRVDLDGLKARKLQRLKSLLRQDMPSESYPDHYDFLTPELRQEFNIIDTTAVSSSTYRQAILDLIEKHKDGLILDCGAGSRSIYFDNVVNFEIAKYPSTDVRGVGEVLPFKDNSFDAVLSITVLEHVKDPWKCAKEILRVLKPGGDLYCVVPFLQPLHGYPHHYYNMSHQGLVNLFEGEVDVTLHEVYDRVLPIWTLTWIANSWAQGLSGEALEEFKSLRVADLLTPATDHLDRSYVQQLSEEKNFELASATAMHAVKRQSPPASLLEKAKRLFR